MTSSTGRTVHFLLVEDDSLDVIAVQRQFRLAKIANPLHIAKDGLEALEILRGESAGNAIEAPVFILLDLNMPRMNGVEFLDVFEREEFAREALVIAFSGSTGDAERLVDQERVAGCVRKEHFQADLEEQLAKHEHFWRIVEIPPSDD